MTQTTPPVHSDTTHTTAIKTAVEQVRMPYGTYTLHDLGATVQVQVTAAGVIVQVQLEFPIERYQHILEALIATAVRTVSQVAAVQIVLQWQIRTYVAQAQLQPLQAVKNILVVASGKGGVGKSTTAANLALGLQHDGAAVGLLDADIYGPSQVRMMGLSGQRPSSRDGKHFEPLQAHGIKVMSIGLLIDEEQPMVWRGPMVTQALLQLLGDCLWGALDYLVVDMPPGTGDIQLTLSQRVPISGAVIVTTPQDIALLDARKGLKMFEKVGVPVLGIVENMSTHICTHCGHEEHVFGAGGGQRMAQQYGVDVLAELPLDRQIREQSDNGCPTVVALPDSRLAALYIEMARRTAMHLAVQAHRTVQTAPVITVEHT